jgi:hypothetical protein
MLNLIRLDRRTKIKIQYRVAFFPNPIHYIKFICKFNYTYYGTQSRILKIICKRSTLLAVESGARLINFCQDFYFRLIDTLAYSLLPFQNF